MKTCVLLSLFLLTGIIRRHDVSDERYLNYAGDELFDPIVLFPDGVGTLIHEEWVITAAHVAREYSKNDSVQIRGKFVGISGIRLYNGDADLALVKLSLPVNFVKPALLVEKPPAAGTIIYLAGNGDTGTGLTGVEVMDKKIRAATNRLDRVDSRHLVFEFDPPESENTTELEGISGPGDSGGPAFIKDGDAVRLAGVSSGQDTRGRPKEGMYGVWEYYVNVHSYLSWISQSIAGKSFNAAEIGGQAVQGLPKDQQIPAFVTYVKQVSSDLGITSGVSNVSFSISPERFVINGTTVDGPTLEKALDKYKDIFGRHLEGTIKFELE